MIPAFSFLLFLIYFSSLVVLHKGLINHARCKPQRTRHRPLSNPIFSTSNENGGVDDDDGDDSGYDDGTQGDFPFVQPITVDQLIDTNKNIFDSDDFDSTDDEASTKLIESNWRLGLCKHKVLFEGVDKIRRLRLWNSQLAFGMLDGKVCIIDLDTGSILERFKAQDREVSALELDKDRLYTGCVTGETCILSRKTFRDSANEGEDEEDNELYKVVETVSDLKMKHHTRAVTGMKLTHTKIPTTTDATPAHRQLMLSIGMDRQLIAVDTLTGELVYSVPLTDPPLCMDICYEGPISTYSAGTNSSDSTAVGSDPGKHPEPTSAATLLGKYVAIGFANGLVGFYKVSTGAQVLSFRAYRDVDRVRALSFPSEHVLITGSNGGICKRWDLSSPTTTPLPSPTPSTSFNTAETATRSEPIAEENDTGDARREKLKAKLDREIARRWGQGNSKKRPGRLPSDLEPSITVTPAPEIADIPNEGAVLETNMDYRPSSFIDYYFRDTMLKNSAAQSVELMGGAERSMKDRFKVASDLVSQLTVQHSLFKTLEDNAAKIEMLRQADVPCQPQSVLQEEVKKRKEAVDNKGGQVADDKMWKKLEYRYALLMSVLEPEGNSMDSNEITEDGPSGIEGTKIEEEEERESLKGREAVLGDTTKGDKSKELKASSTGKSSNAGEGVFDRVKVYRREAGLAVGDPIPPIVAVQGDDDKIIAAFEDGSIVSWDTETTSINFELQGRSPLVSSLQFDLTRLLADGTNNLIVCHDFSELTLDDEDLPYNDSPM